MILPDYPIENREQDQLKRTPLAEKVATMISDFKGKESFVVGVEGKWGSGKTSFINLVLKQLDDSHIAYFTFNPWVFSDEASLLQDFFLRYSEIVEQIKGKKVGRKILNYLGKLSDIDLPIPKWEYIKSALKLFSKGNSLEAARKELNKELASIDKKIVVVIDDIDRLDKKETKLIFKLVKLTADFPNTIFVLAYDREHVEKKIEEDGSAVEGGEYLKKIVQVSFALPIPDQQELWSILFRDLDITLKEVYKKNEVLEEGAEERRWNELFNSGFGGLFETIRDIKRYISSLRLYWRVMGTSDVNKIDFLGITAINVFTPKFYAAIPANRELFIEPPDFFTRLAHTRDNGEQLKRKRYQELLELIPNSHTRERIDKLCKELFPQLDSSATHSTEGWERELRICAPERFKFYFQLGIPHGEISESQIDEIVAALSDKETFSKLILQLKEDKRLRRFLTKLLQRRDTLDKEKIKTALSTFWDLEKEIDDEREAVLDLNDVGTQVMRFAYHALKQLSLEDRKSLLGELYNECKNLYYPSHLLHVLEDEHNKETQRSGEPILDNQTIQSLKQVMAEKIKAATANGTLKDEKHLVALLYRLKVWESQEAVSNYIRDLIANRDGLLTFLKSFVSKVLSTAGNYYDLNPDSIADLYSIDEVRNTVNAIPEGEVTAMSDKDREAIGLLKKRPRQW